jgi:hypothetical protein
LTLAIINLASHPTECENQAIAQDALAVLLTHASGSAAPDLKSRLQAFLKDASHYSRLNALTLHVLNSRSVPFFCDFFHALSLLGHAVPAEFQVYVAPALRRAIMTARCHAFIQKVASCYIELIGIEMCIAAVADSLISAKGSTESLAVAIALASFDSDRTRLPKSDPDNPSITFAPLFHVDIVAYAATLPSLFCSLPSAALRGLSLQIFLNYRTHPSVAPHVLTCLFSLPHFLLKGFVFNIWMLLVRKMQCSATILSNTGDSVFHVCFGNEGLATSTVDFSHRTGVAAILLPLRWQHESACSTFIFELASNYSDFSDEGLSALQNVLLHLADCCDALSVLPTIACVLVKLCTNNHHIIEELIEIIKSCQTIWSHVLLHLMFTRKQGAEFHPSCRRLAEVLLSCISNKQLASIKRGIFSPETCSLFVSWGEILGSYDLIVTMWLDATVSECFISSCDRSTCASVLHYFFSSPSHADSLHSMAKKFNFVVANVSKSDCCSRFTICCIETLQQVMASSAQVQTAEGLCFGVTDSAISFLNVLLSQHIPVFENSSSALVALEFILQGVQSSESSLSSLSGQALSSLFRYQVTDALNASFIDALRIRIESIISTNVVQLFETFRQCEYTAAARVVSAGLLATCSYVSGFTSATLLREVHLRSRSKSPLDSNQLSCRETLSTIRLFLGPECFVSCGSLCALRFMKPWDDISRALALDCVSVTLMNSHRHLSQDELVTSVSSRDDDQKQEFAGKLHAFERRKMFRIIYEGLMLLSEILTSCHSESIQISPDWLERIYVDVMGLCCNVDHVGASETAAAVLLQIFEIRGAHLQAMSRMLLFRTLARTYAALSLEDSNLLEFLKTADNCVTAPEMNIESYSWRRSSHICLPIVSSLKALLSSHHLRLRDGTDVFDAFFNSVMVHVKLNPASKSGVDCLNLLYFITNDHAMTSRVHSRRSEMLSVCFSAFGSNSFNCQSAACLLICNLVTKLYGVLFARKREYELKARSLTSHDWEIFTSLSPNSAPGALIALLTIFSMIRASDDELLSLEPFERSRSLVLACCRSPIAKLRFSASRALPRLVAPSATPAFIHDLKLALVDAKRKQHWNHMHGLTLAVSALQESLR